MEIEHAGTLSEQVARLVRDRIVEGRLRAGEKIRPGDLAEELAVSPTPVREGLSRLASEGFVDARARRGFFVQEPDVDEVAQLYGIRAILDPAALELAGVPDAGKLGELRALNARLRRAAPDPERAVDLDDRWHLELLAGCPNRVLLDLIRRFMKRTRPLEVAYMGSRGTLDAVGAEHDAILDALEGGELDAAVERLRRNMRSGLDPILRWLRGEG